MSSYSYCKTYGKDKVIFVTKEDHSIPSTIVLPAPEPAQGLITKEGEINWSCPCLGGMATGPCGVEFRDAFSCFHQSVANPQGSDCLETFRTMQECFIKYPTIYNKNEPGDDDDDTSSITASAPINTVKEEKTIETIPLTESQALEKK